MAEGQDFGGACRWAGPDTMRTSNRRRTRWRPRPLSADQRARRLGSTLTAVCVAPTPGRTGSGCSSVVRQREEKGPAWAGPLSLAWSPLLRLGRHLQLYGNCWRWHGGVMAHRNREGECLPRSQGNDVIGVRRVSPGGKGALRYPGRLGPGDVPADRSSTTANAPNMAAAGTGNVSATPGIDLNPQPDS